MKMMMTMKTADIYKKGKNLINILLFSFFILFIFFISPLHCNAHNGSHSDFESIKQLNQSLKKYNTDNVIYTDNEDTLIKYAYEQFNKGKGIIVAYSGVLNDTDYQFIENEDLDVLLTHVIENNCNGTSIGGITLWGNIENYQKGIVKVNSYTLICISLNYRNSLDEMKQLSDFYKNTYESLNNEYKIYKLSSFEKVKVIHDYICENFDYDENLNNYDDFGALIPNENGNHLMVCQGYSLMFAKLVNMTGVECRILLSTDKSHSWNIVKINNLWYQTDVTHDDTGYFNRTYDYKYFLRSSISGEENYQIIKNCFLYSSIDDISFSNNDYDNNLWNRYGINKYVYDFFCRTLFTNSSLCYKIIGTTATLLCLLILKKIKRYFYKKKIRRKNDYDLYNNF